MLPKLVTDYFTLIVRFETSRKLRFEPDRLVGSRADAARDRRATGYLPRSLQSRTVAA